MSRSVRAALADWLHAGAGGAAQCERRIETPISWVYLFEDRVLKQKRPVDFGFLDFTSPEKRKIAVARELRLNLRMAPDIYRRVLGVAPDGAGFRWVAFDDPQAVDFILEMRRFDETAVLAHRPEALDGDLAESLGRAVAKLHAEAPAGQAGGGADGLAYVVSSNADHWRHLCALLGEAPVEEVASATRARLAEQGPLLDRRADQGFVRQCHGDLHLGNILLEDGQCRLFDCIEFNDRLSEIDILYDLAFLLMDLGCRGKVEAANRALNGWLDAAARDFAPAALYQGLAALPLFLSVRAGVRCHVCGHQGEGEAARAYLAAALQALDTGPAELICVGGLSGSGKTSLARALAPRLGASPGAVILRSDEVRKRLAGVAPLTPLPAVAYSAQVDAQVYEALFSAAEQVLSAGRSVILDATFRDPVLRARALSLSPKARGIWLDARPDVLRARVAGRQGDASDADLAVLEHQLSKAAPVTDWQGVDAEAPMDRQVALGLGR